MDRRIAGSLAVGISAILVAAALVYQQHPPSGAGNVVQASYGPAGQSYDFAAQPTGRGTALNDCVVCHAITPDGPMRAAPSLWGIVGAPKARSDWFAYSAPLRHKGGTWSREELDRFLSDPSAYLPGTAKTLPPIRDAARRAQVIAALGDLHD